MKNKIEIINDKVYFIYPLGILPNVQPTKMYQKGNLT